MKTDTKVLLWAIGLAVLVVAYQSDRASRAEEDQLPVRWHIPEGPPPMDAARLKVGSCRSVNPPERCVELQWPAGRGEVNFTVVYEFDGFVSAETFQELLDREGQEVILNDSTPPTLHKNAF